MKKNILALLILFPMFSLAEEAPANSSTLIFKSKGEAMNVLFYTSTSEQPCEGLDSVAGVYDAELLQQKLLPFIAKMQKKARAVTGILPEVKVDIKPGIPLQVLGQSKWSDKFANTWTSGQCGPFTQQFTPQAGRQYLALFEFAGGSCGQSIQDITDPAAPVPVALQPLQCTLPRFK